MHKSTHFFGNSVFGQLISLIDPQIISKSVKKNNSDRYVKKFKTKDHLISMLFSSIAKCTSLREVSGAMLGLSGKTKHFQLNHIPKKSTLSDANKRRDSQVFGDIYNNLLKRYAHFISDSRIKDVINKQIEIIDSSTISLFKDILKCVAAIYKLRWQIELLFKQLKQNFPLKYFLGDNENAIKIQIYSALIANLLMTVIQNMLKENGLFQIWSVFAKFIYSTTFT